MLSAVTKTGDVLASDVSKSDGPFTCPMCKGGVLVKKGFNRICVFPTIHMPIAIEVQVSNFNRICVFPTIHIVPYLDVIVKRSHLPICEASILHPVQFYYQHAPCLVRNLGTGSHHYRQLSVNLIALLESILQPLSYCGVNNQQKRWLTARKKVAITCSKD